MLTYPECPTCDETAEHRPVSVERGVSHYFVHHQHADCDTYRYAATITPSGQVDGVDLGDLRFEDVLKRLVGGSTRAA